MQLEGYEMFEELSCEEYYGDDISEDYKAWLDALEIEYVNSELQMIADEQQAAQVEVELDALVLG